MGKGVCAKCRIEKDNAKFYAVGGRIIITCEDCERSGNGGSMDVKQETRVSVVNGQIMVIPISPQTGSQPQVTGTNSSQKPFPILPTNY